MPDGIPELRFSGSLLVSVHLLRLHRHPSVHVPYPTSEDLTFKNAEWKPVIADTWFFVRHLSKIIASFISGDKIGQNQEYLGISSHTLSLLAGERVDIGHHLWPQDPLRLRQEGSPPVKGPQYAELLVSTLLTWLTLTVDEEMQDTGTDNSGEKDDRDY